LLITTNIRVAANEPRLYDYSVDRFDAAAKADIPEAELKWANRELIRYLNNDEQLVRIEVRDNSGAQVPLFNPQERAHLADVKDLFQKVFLVQQATLAYVLVILMTVFLWAGETSLRRLAAALFSASGLTLALVAGVGLAAFIGFDDFWLRFHFLAFANDFWLLDPARDHLIQMFPRDFWYGVTLLIGAFTALEALALGALSGLYLYATRPVVKTEPQTGQVALPEPPRPWHSTQ